MKSCPRNFHATTVLLLLLIAQVLTTSGQGTAFLYQGRLNDAGNPANGIYDFSFTLYATNMGSAPLAGPLTNSAALVTNGLFNAALDFGSGVFSGGSYWLEIGVRTNGGSVFTQLNPRQALLPAPYSIMANSASNLLGTVPAAQLRAGTAGINISGNAATATTASSAATATTAASFSGPLSGDVTGAQGATVVSAVAGTSAADVGAGANAANAATSVDTAGTIVKRDASGNFSAGTIMASLVGNATSATTASNLVAGTTISGTFRGDGSGLTNVAGTVVWQTVGATNLTDAVNEYYLLTNNTFTTLNLSASPSVGDVITVSGAGSNGWQVVPAAGQGIAGLILQPGEFWTEQSGVPISSNWACIASSADGTVLAAAIAYGPIYVSTNSGSIWTQSGAPQVGWISMASSADGSHMVAVPYSTGLYTSTDYGNTWIIQASAPADDYWVSVASDASGQYLAAVELKGIYTSTNFGVNWTKHTNGVPGSQNTFAQDTAIASSSDGSRLVLVAGINTHGGPSGIFTSTNFGVNWTKQTNGVPVNNQWTSVASDANGQHLIATSNGGGTYTSSDFGVTWTYQSAATRDFESIACDSTGQFLVGVVSGGSVNGLYSSTNFGANWSLQAGAPTNTMRAVASSSDGTRLAAVQSQGGIYLSSGPIIMPFVGVAGQTVQFQYVGNGVWQPSGTAANITIPASQLPGAIATNAYPDADLAAATFNPLRHIITVNGIKNLSSILGGDGGGLFNLSASGLSGGIVPQSVLPGFQGTCDVVGGGSNNIATGGFATVPGGCSNSALGTFSFAAGYNAQATNIGAFVWSDGTGTLTTCTNDNSVTFRASGGYRFFTGTAAAGAQLKAGATSWSSLSDRSAKKNFTPVNYQEILDKLAQVPIQKWNYNWENDTNTPNIGPMAQDFKTAFYPGRDESTISTLEFDGVELAAIQGLYQKLKEKNSKLQEQSVEIRDLKARLDRLERSMRGVYEKSK